MLGEDARDIRALMARLAQRFHLYGRNGPLIYALSAIDIALWDIAGKQAKLPLWRLLGAAPCDRLDAYASLLRYGDPDAVATMTARAVGQGYRAVKLHEIAVPEIRAGREAAGAATRLMVDTNCPWTVEQAIGMARSFQPFDLDWLEEPVWPPEDHAGLARVRREGGIRIAAGENAAGLHDFRHQFEAGALDVAQPSVTKIGGVTEMLRIAALAQAFSVRLVPTLRLFRAGLPGLAAPACGAGAGLAVRTAVHGAGGESVRRYGARAGWPGGGAERRRARARSGPGGAAALRRGTVDDFTLTASRRFEAFPSGSPSFKVAPRTIGEM